jgi:predicted phosphodiesterase
VTVALISDVHANLPALEAVLEVLGGVAESYVCLGDTVNYGPWNDECLERIHDLPRVRVIEGNHERLFLEPALVSRESPLVQQFYWASRSSFTRYDLLRGLPNETRVGSFTCTHTIGGKRIFGDTEIEVDRDYFIGHSHWQYDVRRGPWRLVNPGSVGQNRDRIELASFALYDEITGAVSLQSIPYDIDRFLGELKRRRWPLDCVRYYERKRRESRARASQPRPA